MNQNQVREGLLRLDRSFPDFTVILSGKKSRKVDGLYKPETREIIIHNKNFPENDSALMYTAIHEFAHHLHFSVMKGNVSSRSHTNQFWDIFHRLLFEAEKKGIYENIFDREPAFAKLTEKIKNNYLIKDGRLLKEFGGLLLEAFDLCQKFHASFSDYADRVLGLHRNHAKNIMKIHGLDVPPEIGFENMKTVARISDPERRTEAQKAFLEGESPDMVRARITALKKPGDELEMLRREKIRLEKSIANLNQKLSQIEKKIKEIHST